MHLRGTHYPPLPHGAVVNSQRRFTEVNMGVLEIYEMREAEICCRYEEALVQAQRAYERTVAQAKARMETEMAALDHWADQQVGRIS